MSAPSSAVDWSAVWPNFRVALDIFYGEVGSKDRNGPLSLDDLRDLWDSEVIDSNTLVWSSTINSWVKISDAPPLLSYMSDDEAVGIADEVSAAKPDGESQQQQQQQQQEAPSSSTNDEAADSTVQSSATATGPGNSNVEYSDEYGTWVCKQAEQGCIHIWNAETETWDIMPFQEDTEPPPESPDSKTKDTETPVEEEKPAKEEKAAPDAPAEETATASEKKRSRKRRRKEVEEFKGSEHASAIYVTGLPGDITEDEVSAYFQRCGVIQVTAKGKPRIRLYKKDDGTLKGDATVYYLNAASVPLAFDILDETEIRPGFMITLDRATFEAKKDYVKKDHGEEGTYKDRLKALERQKKKLLEWRMQDEVNDLSNITEQASARFSRHCVIANVLDPAIVVADNADTVVAELSSDLCEECSSRIGPVKALEIGLSPKQTVCAIVLFTTPAHATACAKLMNGRWFDKRRLDASVAQQKSDVTVQRIHYHYDEAVAALEKQQRKSQKKKDKNATAAAKPSVQEAATTTVAEVQPAAAEAVASSSDEEEEDARRWEEFGEWIEQGGEPPEEEEEGEEEGEKEGMDTSQ